MIIWSVFEPEMCSDKTKMHFQKRSEIRDAFIAMIDALAKTCMRKLHMRHTVKEPKLSSFQ